MSRLFFLVFAAATLLAAARAAEAPVIDLREFQRQRLELLLEQTTPPVPEAQRARLTRDFLQHLRRSALLTAERLDRGELDDAELTARLNVFLGERPELRADSAARRDVASRVSAALARTAGTPPEDPGRRQLAQAFIEHLRSRQPMASTALAEGLMPENELESRLAVFLADRRTESANSGEQRRATAAATAFAERFVAANFGPAAERLRSLALRGTIEEDGRKREFTLFRRHPNLVRFHFVENGVVTIAVGSDGAQVWRQEAAGRAAFLGGAEARALRELAEFDHPFIDVVARGSVMKLLTGDPTGTAPVELELVRADGVSIRSTIDPATLEERTTIRIGPDGKRVETRLSDYRQVGALNLPHRQEAWIDGKLHRTVLITQAEADPELLAEFFARPDGGRFAYLDFMGALEVVRKRAEAARAAPPAAAPTGGGS